MKTPKRSFGKKCHIPSAENPHVACCGAPIAGQNLSAYCRSVITCRSCKKSAEYKKLP